MTSTHEHCKIELIKDERLFKCYHLVQIIMADQSEAGILFYLASWRPLYIVKRYRVHNSHPFSCYLKVVLHPKFGVHAIHLVSMDLGPPIYAQDISTGNCTARKNDCFLIGWPSWLAHMVAFNSFSHYTGQVLWWPCANN
jgi:hypothetical protein